MVVNLANATPEDVPDGHYQDVELYREGIEPRSDTEDLGYFILQPVPDTAGGSRLDDADHVVEELVLSCVAGSELSSFQVVKVDSCTGRLTFYLSMIVRLLSCAYHTLVTNGLLCEVFLDEGVQRLLYDGVDPEGERGAEAVHEGEPGQPLVLVDDHIPELEDEEELDEGEERVEYVLNMSEYDSDQILTSLKV